MMNNLNSQAVEILLVEDNKGDVLLTKKAFRDSKISNKIHVAEDGEMAMNFLHKKGSFQDMETPDIILLDLNLPKKDGKQVLKEIKENPDLRRIPVVIMTSSNAEKDIVKTYNLHANSYVTKPVDLQKFSEIVAAIENFWFTIVVYPDKNS